MMTPEQWRKKYPDEDQRLQFAQTSPLAWILEIQPEVILPGLGRIPYVPFWYQQELLLDESPFRATEKSRQNGISTTNAAELAWELLNIPAAFPVTVSKDRPLVLSFFQYVYQILRSAEVKYKERGLKFPAFGKENEDHVSFPELDSQAIAVAASERAGTGYPATHFRFDETAHSKFARSIFQSASPSISFTGGRISMYSSPRGRATLFHDVINEPEKFGASVHTFPWWYNPVFNPVFDRWYAAFLRKDMKAQALLVEEAKKGEWYRRERPKYSDLEWAQEFECQHDADISAAFTAWQIKNAFRKNWLTEQPTDAGEYWLAPDLDRSHYFAAGVDLGRKNDATVIFGFDYTVKPAKTVMFRRIPGGSGVSWSYIIDEIRKMHVVLNGDNNHLYMRHDATAMGGDTISEALEDISEPFVFSSNQHNKQKYNLIEQMRKAMDEGAVILPRLVQPLREFQTYAWDDKGLTTDSVMAALIAVSIFYEGSGGRVELIPDFNFMS